MEISLDPTDREERLFRALVEAAPDAMVIVDERGVIQLVNGQVMTLFGFEREELVGKPVEVLIPESLHRAHRSHRAGYVQDPRVRAMGAGLDLRARRKDGTEFPAEISLSPLQTDDGMLISATIRDITQKRREERLFRGLLEAAPDGMVIVDSSGTVVLVNAQVEALFGYDRSELIGQRVEVMVPARFAAMHEHFRTGYTARPGTRPMGLAGDLFALRKDGTEFPVEISLAPLETDQGMLISAAVRDVTERRALAEAATRAKDEFFATVSHELRTPLTSLIGYGEMLGDLEDLSEQGKGFLDVMMRSAARETRLVEDLLMLAQIEESGLTIRPAALDVAEVVRESVRANLLKAEEAGLTLHAVQGEGPTMVMGDRDRLGQAVGNLVSNAIKFTPHGGEVCVELIVGESEVYLDVRDTGAGIDEADRLRIFERLYRAPETVAAQVPGAGLGLTIALAIAQAHGGSLQLLDSDGEGSVFRLVLPTEPEPVGQP